MAGPTRGRGTDLSASPIGWALRTWAAYDDPALDPVQGREL